MEFEILVGAQLDQGQFNNLKTQIEGLGKTPIPIKLNFDEAKKEIEKIKESIESLGSKNSGTKNSILNISSKDINNAISSISKLSTVVEDIKKSFSQLGKGTGLEKIEDLVARVTSAMGLLSVDVKKISDSLGVLDKTSGMDNILTSATDTVVALENVSNTIKKTYEMFSKMSGALSNGFNMEFKIGGQDIVSKNHQIRQSSELAIKSLKEEITALQQLLNDGSGNSALNSVFNQGMALFTKDPMKKSTFFDFINEKYSKLSSKNSMSDTISTLKQYIDYMKEIASIKGIDISSVSSISQQSQQFLNDAEKIRSGEQYLEEQTNRLKSIFGNGINAEALTLQLQSVIDKLTELTEVVSSISSSFSGSSFNLGNVESLFNLGSDKGSGSEKTINEVTEAYKRIISVIKEMSSIRLDLNKVDIEENAKEVDVLINRYDELQKEYNELQNTFSSKFSDAQKNNIAKELENASYNKILSSAKIADKQASQIARDAEKAALEQEAQAARKAQEAYQQLINTANQMNKLELQIGGLKAAGGNENQIAQLTSQLEVLREKYNSVMSEMGGQLSDSQIGNLDNISNDLQNQLSVIKAKVQDARNELAKEIQVKFDNGTISNETSKLEQDFKKIKEASSESTIAMEQFRTASNDLQSALQSGDNDRIISSYEQYTQALKTADNQIKINIRSEKEAAEAAKQVAKEQETLSKSNTLSNNIQTWMNNNKKAAQEYGNELKQLQAILNGNVDANKLKEVSLRFKEIKSEASSAGMTIKSFGRSLKDMITMTLGISGTYMAVQKGVHTIRQMFDEVLKVDTAMTELYRITDLSQQKYDNLFQNMSNSAKEYGSSLDEMINSTADWVRLGFKEDDSNRLAEITSMYQHVTDLSNDIAVENLVTAYKGFEDSLLELTGGDTTKSVELVADIYDKLGALRLPIRNYIGQRLIA